MVIEEKTIAAGATEGPTAEARAPDPDKIRDPVAAMPKTTRKLMEAIARQSRENPEIVLVEAKAILQGLEKGTLIYGGIEADSTLVMLKEVTHDKPSVVYLSGPHVSALIQYHGGEVLKRLHGLLNNSQAAIAIAKNLAQLELSEISKRLFEVENPLIPSKPNIKRYSD